MSEAISIKGENGEWEKRGSLCERPGERNTGMRVDRQGEYHFLSEAEMRRIHNASLEILRDVGIKVPNERFLKLLDEAGAQVDYGTQVVKFPPERVESHLDQVRRCGEYEGWVESKEEVGSGEDGEWVIKGTMSGNATRALDAETDQVRPANLKDLEDSIRIANDLECVDSYSPLFTPMDVPLGIEDICAWEACFRLSLKPAHAMILYPGSFEYVLEMGRVVYGDDEAVRQANLLGVTCFISSPLRFTEEALERALTAIDLGFKVSLGIPMMVAGATGPITLAGSITLSNAETLGSMIMASAIGNEPHYVLAPIVMDQSTGAGCYADPRKLLACGVQLDMARFYGLPCDNFHIGMDARGPGIQAATERMFGTMLGLFLRQGRPKIRLGVLGPGGSSASLVQLFIDVEVLEMLNAYLKGIEVDDDRIGLDVIKSVGIGGNFLSEEHTVRFFKDEMWFPKLFERRPSDAGETERDRVAEKARQQLRAALEREEPRPLSEDQERELKRILKAARKGVSG